MSKSLKVLNSFQWVWNSFNELGIYLKPFKVNGIWYNLLQFPKTCNIIFKFQSIDIRQTAMGIPLRVGTSFIEGVINRLKVLTSCNTVAPYIMPPPPWESVHSKPAGRILKKVHPLLKASGMLQQCPPGVAGHVQLCHPHGRS